MLTNKYRTTTTTNISGIFLLTIMIFILLPGCDENPGEFDLSDEYVESQTELTMIDTFSLSFSTIKLDTMTSNGSETFTIGRYSDSRFGKISTRSYFQLGIPSSADIATGDTYDSLCLVLKFSGYYFGDTTTTQTIDAYRLTENIELNDDDLITTGSSFSYDYNSIGSLRYLPRPSNTSDSLLMRIDDTIGKDFFEKLKDNSELLTDYEYFTDYFPGIVLIPDESADGTIIGFTVSETKLRLFTTRHSSSDIEYEYDFSITDTELQFNQILNDYSNTPLANLQEQEYELPSAETNDLVYLMDAAGFRIRIDFPSLDQLMLFEKGILASAELVIYPETNSNQCISLPETLSLYNCNRHNEPDADIAAVGTLVKDDIYSEDTYYTFDLTQYLQEELSDAYVDPENGILIAPYYDNTDLDFSELVLNADHRKTKLKIYYLYY